MDAAWGPRIAGQYTRGTRVTRAGQYTRGLIRWRAAWTPRGVHELRGKGAQVPVYHYLRGIPKTMKSRAEALLAHLKERGDVITWDDMGQVLVDGVLIPKSNISDLVSDAMRSRKHFNPVRVREFYSVLNKINVPKDLVRNERRWGEAGKENVDEKTKELTIPEWISF